MPGGRAGLVWLCAPAAILFAIPFVTLAWNTSWNGLHLAYGDWSAVGVSLGLGGLAMGLVFLLGLPPALWLARSPSRLRPLFETVVLGSLLTPPLAMGILLISAYGPYGSVGEFLARLGATLSNNAAAFVLAQLYGGLAYFILAARAAFEAVPASNDEAAIVLGANRWQTFWLVLLPLARRGLAVGMVMAWVRAVGEFGIVMVFAYFPQGMPVKLFVDLQNDGVDAVYALLWVILLVTLPVPLILLHALKSDA